MSRERPVTYRSPPRPRTSPEAKPSPTPPPQALTLTIHAGRADSRPDRRSRWTATGSASAAGNDGTGQSAGHPPSIKSRCLIAVNAADCRDKLASFSNYHENPQEVTASGVNIIGESPSGPEIDSGTSMASPLVAGTLALEMGEGVDAPTAVRDLLATARKPGATMRHGSHWHTYYGAGMLDAQAAVQKAAKDAATVQQGSL